MCIGAAAFTGGGNKGKSSQSAGAKSTTLGSEGGASRASIDSGSVIGAAAIAALSSNIVDNANNQDFVDSLSDDEVRNFGFGMDRGESLYKGPLSESIFASRFRALNSIYGVDPRTEGREVSFEAGTRSSAARYNEEYRREARQIDRSITEQRSQGSLANSGISAGSQATILGGGDEDEELQRRTVLGG